MNEPRAYSILFVLLAIVGAPLSAQTPNASPESLGLSPERLERVTELMQRHIEEGTFSGAVTLVARDDHIAFFHAQGVMDVETRQAMRQDTVFRIMSMTKPVVALSILMMIEEGKVRLTDPVSRFMPECRELTVALAHNIELDDGAGTASAVSTPVPLRTVAAEREVTVRDLLTHTAGLMSDGPSSDHEVPVGASETVADVVPRLATVPLDFHSFATTSTPP